MGFYMILIWEKSRLFNLLMSYFGFFLIGNPPIICFASSLQISVNFAIPLIRISIEVPLRIIIYSILAFVCYFKFSMQKRLIMQNTQTSNSSFLRSTSFFIHVSLLFVIAKIHLCQTVVISA